MVALLTRLARRSRTFLAWIRSKKEKESLIVTRPARCHPLSCRAVIRRILSMSERSKSFTVVQIAVPGNYRHARHSIARGISKFTGAMIPNGGIGWTELQIRRCQVTPCMRGMGETSMQLFTKARSSLYYRKGLADVAQLVEQSIRNRQVTGSIPVVGSRDFRWALLVSARFHARKNLRRIPRLIWLREDWERTVARAAKEREEELMRNG